MTMTREQIEGLANRLEAAGSYLKSVETKPTVVDLYYPFKRVGVSTGWGYSVTGVTAGDLTAAAVALNQMLDQAGAA